MSVRINQARRHRLAVALLASMCLPAIVLAQETTGTEAKSLDKVQVTGSRIKRAQVEGPVPMVVITEEDIKKLGYSTIAEVLQTLTQFTGDIIDGEYNVGNSAPNGQYLNLRGLGVGYQLVLLNGKRMADYAATSGPGSTGVSTGSIPAAAVARIEILNGGASAIYGSDAVAGVVNIITKENWEGNSLRLRGGTTHMGGGDTGQFQFSGGKAWNNGSITYAFEQLHREPIFVGDRDFMGFQHSAYNKANPDNMQAPQQGVLFYTDGTRRTSNDYIGGTLPATVAPGAVYWMNSAGELVPMINNTHAGNPDVAAALEYSCSNADPSYRRYIAVTTPMPTSVTRCGNDHYYDQATVSNKYNKTSGYLAGNYRFNDNLEGYGQLLVTSSEDASAQYTALYFNFSNLVYDPDLGSVTINRTFTSNTMDAPMTTWNEDAINANLGLRGSLGRYDWDASFTASQGKVHSTVRRYLRSNVLDYFFGPQLGTTTNGRQIREVIPERVFGALSSEDYAAITDVASNRNESKSLGVQLVFSGPLFELPAGEVQMASVLEASNVNYTIDPDDRCDPAVTDIEKFYNFNCVAGDGDRDRYGAGLELSVPLLSNLLLNAAARYDKYDDISDIAGASTWQASLEYRPFQNVLVRASHQTNFMAPNLMWVYGNPIRQYTTQVDRYACRRDGMDLSTTEGLATCNDGTTYDRSLWYTSGGDSTQLQEETATSDGFGFVWDIHEKLSISADYWRVHLKGKSVFLTTAEVLDGNADCLIGAEVNGTPVDQNSARCAAYLGYMQRDENGDLVDFTVGAINRAGVKTDGFDASVRYDFSLGAVGDFRLTGGLTRVLSYKEQEHEGDAWESAMKWTSRVAFATRTNWGLGWSKDSWSARLSGYRNGPRWNYYATRRLHPYVQWNVSVTKRIAPGWSLGLDVINLFNNHAPYDDSYGAWPYYQRIYGIVGHAAYVNLNINF